jgi:adenine-specific DNA methylase
MSNKKGAFLFLMAFIVTAAIAQAEALTPTYSSYITPDGPEGGLGTIKLGGSSVTITATSISAISDSATTESSGSINWTPPDPMTVTITFDYQITNPGSNFVIYQADWFGETFKYTDGEVKTFSQTFDIENPRLLVSVKAKNGKVSIKNISVKII